ncbi:hypothetical protein BJ322DRAFT_436391 [Thelephora terrestris]|uniref:Snf7-domain-containing protein n=1 Tax=Thelephora terrestris TaxID=56493 RepID=A0A9P6HNQ9_9AGAM|nr:hypothetical protein BJ322DRAFT_436391 [Thelephora terrestris]
MSTGIKYTDLHSLPAYNISSTSRLKSLYSDVSRQKHSNPTSYRSTVHWWREVLQAVVLKHWLPQSSDTLVLHALPTLADSFRYEGAGKPLCLATVISELHEEKAYIPLNQFLTATQSIYDPGWLPYRIASYVIGKPLLWALQQTGAVGSGDVIESDTQRWKRVKGDYVLRDLVESAAQGILAHQRTKESGAYAEKLYTVESFKREFSSAALPDVVLSDLDLKVLVKHLERDMRVVVVDGKVIKFVYEDTDNQTITAVDSGLLELKNAVQNLNIQIESIQAQIKERTEKASSALKQNRKEIALGHLRARKQLEDMLVKRSKALENLESTLWTVEHAAGDVELMKLYESSTVTLRTILSHPSLQRNKIDETMDALHSATEDAKDVDLTIRLAGEAEQAATIDDDEIERELRALVQDAENEKLAAQERAALEDVKELEGRLGEVKVPADVPRAVDDRERDAEVAMGVRA